MLINEVKWSQFMLSFLTYSWYLLTQKLYYDSNEDQAIQLICFNLVKFHNFDITYGINRIKNQKAFIRRVFHRFKDYIYYDLQYIHLRKHFPVFTQLTFSEIEDNLNVAKNGSFTHLNEILFVKLQHYLDTLPIEMNTSLDIVKNFFNSKKYNSSFKVFKNIDQQNCVYAAISNLLFGGEEEKHFLRLFVILYLYRFGAKDYVINWFEDNKIGNKDFKFCDISALIRYTSCIDSNVCGLVFDIHLHVLSFILKRDISLLVIPNKRRTGVNRIDYNFDWTLNNQRIYLGVKTNTKNNGHAFPVIHI